MEIKKPDEIQADYFNLILSQAPRLLTLLDREEFSPTYGCFDRSFWHYKFITDYPCARYQEASLVLVLLYSRDFPGNVFYKNPKILEWVTASLRYWTTIQNKDGSFNEAYPNEHSFITTAFTLCAVSESFMILNQDLPKDLQGVLLKAMIKAGVWLSRHEDRLLANHTAGSVLALYNIFLITSDIRFNQAFRRKLIFLLQSQTPEGWFPEYMGADLGYLSLTIDFLAKYYAKSKDEKIIEPLEKAVEFMSYFVHPDGSFGGDYGSRNTEFFYPAGLEILKEKIPKANRILKRIYPALKQNTLISPSYMDDRYFAFEIGNFLQAALEYKYVPEVKQPGDTSDYDFEKDFTLAGLKVIQTQKYYIVFNYKKGGVTEIFTNSKDKNKLGKLVFSDSGFAAKLSNGKLAITQLFNPSAEIRNLADEKGFSASVEMFYWKIFKPLKKLFLPFRIFNYLVGQSQYLMHLFNYLLKKKLFISTPKSIGVKINKTISLKDNEIVIKDEIFSDLKFQRFIKVTNLVPQHTSAARYFLESQLEAKSDFVDLADRINRQGYAESEHIVKLNS